MAVVIAVANQKGGVGKTTTTLNLGVSLAYLAQEILLVDLDSQANLTSGLLAKRQSPDIESADISDLILSPNNEQAGSPQATRRGEVPAQALAPTRVEFLDLLPARDNLVGAELLLKDMPGRETRLKEALRPLHSMYRYILIDCPPSLGLLTVNALCAADYVLIPMTAEYYALEGLSTLAKVIERVQETQNPGLRLLGVVFTMFDPRLQLTQAVVREVRQHFAEAVWDTTIPRNVRIAEAPSFSLPIHIYAPRSPGTQAYMDLGKELLVRV